MADQHAIDPGPLGAEQLARFLDSFFYAQPAILFDRIVAIEVDEQRLVAQRSPTAPLPIAQWQRGDPARHPRHVSAAELLMMTGTLGCLAAWCFHGCRWDEGWIGFGNRIHRADFRELAAQDRPLDLECRTTRSRQGARRVMCRFAFTFTQGEKVVYTGDQSAIFVLDPPTT